MTNEGLIGPVDLLPGRFDEITPAIRPIRQGHVKMCVRPMAMRKLVGPLPSNGYFHALDRIQNVQAQLAVELVQVEDVSKVRARGEYVIRMVGLER